MTNTKNPTHDDFQDPLIDIQEPQLNKQQSHSANCVDMLARDTEVLCSS